MCQKHLPQWRSPRRDVYDTSARSKAFARSGLPSETSSLWPILGTTCLVRKVYTTNLKFGFGQCAADSTLFICPSSVGDVFLLFYADEMNFIGSDAIDIQTTRSFLTRTFKMTDLDHLVTFLDSRLVMAAEDIFYPKSNMHLIFSTFPISLTKKLLKHLSP